MYFTGQTSNPKHFSDWHLVLTQSMGAPSTIKQVSTKIQSAYIN